MLQRLGIFILLSLTALLPVYAAAPEEEQEELTWYDVEIIIFRHHDLLGASKENWPQFPGEPDFRNAFKLLPALPKHLSLAHSSRLRKPIPFSRLREDELRMTDRLERLMRAKTFQPLIHMGWRQPGYDREEAKAVHIHGGVLIRPPQDDKQEAGEEMPNEVEAYYDDGLEGPPPPMINGTIKLIRTRFLHVEADLLYHNMLPEQKDDIKLPTRYFRLQTSRRMRSKEIHYIDHPMFGMLVLITPYEDPNAVKEQTGSDNP
jgi:hypothetical protein